MSAGTQGWVAPELAGQEDRTWRGILEQLQRRRDNVGAAADFVTREKVVATVRKYLSGGRPRARMSAAPTFDPFFGFFYFKFLKIDLD